MLTIFASPKPFRGHFKTIQTNALKSWRALGSDIEIILLGDSEGTAEAAYSVGAKHEPTVECNEHGTPLLSSIFYNAERLAVNERLCYVNADIILFQGILDAVKTISWGKFLLVGQRIDVDICELLDFSEPSWEDNLRDRVAQYGELHQPTGIDYFVYPKGVWSDIPPLAIGRPGFDNWIIYEARRTHIPVINATDVVSVIHQNHDYSHHPEGKEGVWSGPEAAFNRSQLSTERKPLDVRDATWRLTSKGLKRTLSRGDIYRHLNRLPTIFPWAEIPVWFAWSVIRLLRYIRSKWRSAF